MRQQLGFGETRPGGSGPKLSGCSGDLCRTLTQETRGGFPSAVLSERPRPGEVSVREGVFSSHFAFKRLRSIPRQFLDLISSSGRRDPKSIEQPILLKEG